MRLKLGQPKYFYTREINTLNLTKVENNERRYLLLFLEYYTPETISLIFAYVLILS